MNSGIARGAFSFEQYIAENGYIVKPGNFGVAPGTMRSGWGNYRLVSRPSPNANIGKTSDL